MRLRNGPHGYGLATKLLHWLTFAVVVTQFAVGWTMNPDDALDREDERLDVLEERSEEGGEASEERAEAEIDRREDALDAREDDIAADTFSDLVSGDFLSSGVSGLEWHVLFGLIVLALGVLRVVWRMITPLPPWAEHLAAGERTFESWLEKILLSLLLVVPLTGLFMVAGSTGLLPVHVGAQIALLTAVSLHVSLVLKHTVVRRNRHLARML
ncbi:cytochrome b [Solicola gregarius]|uniref:Cytochrome b/b6 domain-containing protein n=1 Tax=Solicola gregarius TaxID=2908642 RepID=A0AA46TLH0_9ACTN|nr:cytochrome b/b6 domain-containing protein [Solicola gregarius]UYM07477.1 cytochrome b/b6 domain-containing protein [Solicola gregarius]